MYKTQGVGERNHLFIYFRDQEKLDETTVHLGGRGEVVDVDVGKGRFWPNLRQILDGKFRV